MFRQSPTFTYSATVLFWNTLAVQFHAFNVKLDGLSNQALSFCQGTPGSYTTC